MTAPHKLVLRCDANVAIGTGHVMRCIALAQAWQDAGGNALFVMAAATPSIEARLRVEGAKVIRLESAPGTPADSIATRELAKQEGAAWVVVDGYQFDANYQSALRSAGLKVLFVDDNGESSPYSADLVLNQNLHASEDMYRRRDAHTRLLLGPRYILLRREFRFWRKRKVEVPERARRILVTMGGSDPENVTEQILQVLLAESGLELTVVVGGSNPHVETIESLITGTNRSVRLLKDVANMPPLMVWADLAVAGAGTTSWEMCMMGLPAALCTVAANQEKIASELARLGAAVDLGYPCKAPRRKTEAALRQLVSSAERRSKMSARGREIVDGHGAERVQTFLWGEPVLRRTIDSDCRDFWEWANDPAARAVSFAKEPIPWERHMEWFRARLADPQSILYTALNRLGEAMGMVRYQLQGSHAILSINLGAPFRSKGNGRKLLFLSTQELFENSGVTSIDAFVRPSNQASVRLFEGAGFRNTGLENVHGDQAIHYVLEKRVMP